ncbi:hypothetical protein HZS_2560 [Henneguya salminicola]|nr:hypothetical protein HZS_2560 [Henneguya salminicola]
MHLILSSHGRNFPIADQTNRSIIAITSSDTNEFISSIRLHFCYHKVSPLSINLRRKSYVVSIGRITPSKLANFANIQAWVLVSCYYNTLINDKEFLRPIITPMECYMACSLYFMNNLNQIFFISIFKQSKRLPQFKVGFKQLR